MRNHLSAIRALVHRVGADVNARGDDGSTAIMVAAMHGKKEAVVALGTKGAKLEFKNARGGSPLPCSAQPRLALHLFDDSHATLHTRVHPLPTHLPSFICGLMSSVST